MAGAPGRHRLPCRYRPPLLLRALSLRPPAGRGKDHRADGRNLLQGRAHRRASAHERQQQAYDHPRIEASGEAGAMSHAEWLGLLLDREITHRYDRKLLRRLRYARLRHQAAIEDVDYRAARGLDRGLFQKLAEGSWIDAHDNLIITGPTGVGKSWLASALGHKACRDDRSVLYQRVPKLFGDLQLARGDGRYGRLFRALAGVQLLILDDWGLEPLTAEARHDLLEILEERYGRHSTIVTSQLPVDKWHEVIGNPTYADAVLDRLVHNGQRVELAGESLRRKRPHRSAMSKAEP